MRVDSELHVSPQFDYTSPLVGRGLIIVWGSTGPKSTTNAERTALNIWTEASRIAKVRTTICRARAKVRVIKRIQHLGLKKEAYALANWKPLTYRQVVVPVVRPIKPDTLADYSRGCVRGDVGRIRSPAGS